MEMVDVYGFFLILFLFSNFILMYYNFFFQIFFSSKAFFSSGSLSNMAQKPLNKVGKLVNFQTTLNLFYKGVGLKTLNFKNEIFK